MMVWVDRDLFPPRYRDPVWIAAGGMGALYRAVDDMLDRPVAIKLLAERYGADGTVRSRFRREALAAARLSGDPNTVMIFDVGEWQGTPFIVMEYLGGGTLEQKLKDGPQRPEQALTWLEQAASSLDAAHAHGVVHRDVKPANLLLDQSGHVHVGDFGIATRPDSTHSRSPARCSEPSAISHPSRHRDSRYRQQATNTPSPFRLRAPGLVACGLVFFRDSATAEADGTHQRAGSFPKGWRKPRSASACRRDLHQGARERSWIPLPHLRRVRRHAALGIRTALGNGDPADHSCGAK